MIVDEERLLRCIHCGFCLSACPTYVVSGDEADSPRGRIYFLRALAENRIEATETIKTHLDRCLTCFSCEVACPSGVEYRHLIESARAWLTRNSPRKLPFGWRTFLRHVMPRARLLRWLLLPVKLARAVGLRSFVAGVVRLLPVSWPGRSMDLLPERIPSPFEPPPPALSAAKGERKIRVGYVPGCVMEGMLPELNRLTIALLQELGCEVVVPRDAGCCGAMAQHEGERDLAVKLAGSLVKAFASADVDVIIASAAGCGSTMKGYGELLGGGATAKAFAGKVRDFTEVAADLVRDNPPRETVPIRVAYHEACHLGAAQGIRVQPRALLMAIPGVIVSELPEQELCCGSAGVYNILQPKLADELKDRKTAHAMEGSVDAIVTANPGCLLQIRNGLKNRARAPKVVHLVELLARGYGLPMAHSDV